jgi:hypothetical protein
MVLLHDVQQLYASFETISFEDVLFEIGVSSLLLCTPNENGQRKSNFFS